VSERDDGIDARRFFFVHVMKTAGTTFARQLQQQFPKESIYPCREIDWISEHDFEAYVNIPRLLALGAERRAGIRMYTGHFPFFVCERIDPELVTLTVLRDPVERTISVLKHFKRVEERFHDLSLEAVYEDRQIFRFFVENHQTKVFSLGLDDNEQAINCGLTIDDARFARARDNLARVDVIGLTEHYDRFLAEVRDRFGWWAGGLDLAERANVSSEDWAVPAAFRERIAADNAYDLQLYEIARDLVRSR
jgi:hypothetical protein